jgi:hypothetical protein
MPFSTFFFVYGFILLVVCMICVAISVAIFSNWRADKRIAKLKAHHKAKRSGKQRADKRENILNRIYNTLLVASRANSCKIEVSRITSNAGAIGVLVRHDRPGMSKDLQPNFRVYVMREKTDGIDVVGPNKENWHWGTDDTSILKALKFLSTMTEIFGVNGKY